jgi:acyl dehydratase
MVNSSDMTTGNLYLEDLSEGMMFESPDYKLDAGQIQSFARSFDPQPFHLDDTAAQESLFGGLAASGWHTAAITMKLLVASLPLAGGVIGAGGEISWPRPTRPSDVLRVISTIVSVVPSKSKPDRGIVTVQSDTQNQHGDVCQRFVARLVVFRRAG